MASVNVLIEKLLESPSATVAEAGGHLLGALSGNQLQRDEFLNDPLILVGPPYFASRYLAQVALRALQSEYETLDEVMASLQALIRAESAGGFGCRLRRRNGHRIVEQDAATRLETRTKSVSFLRESTRKQLEAKSARRKAL